jgi:MerR family transcriptional regulator, redox-sensitive transcriptional activator SoxR
VVEPMLTIGELSRRTGLATSALRFYEEKGLIASERSSSGQRRFRRDALRRVAFIRVAQRVGVSLDEIAEALATLPAGRNPTRRDWARLSKQWRERLDERIGLLQGLRDGLTSCIGCGCLSLATCRLYNPDDRASAFGPGPRFLLGDPREEI